MGFSTREQEQRLHAVGAPSSTRGNHHAAAVAQNGPTEERTRTARPATQHGGAARKRKSNACRQRRGAQRCAAAGQQTRVLGSGADDCAERALRLSPETTSPPRSFPAPQLAAARKVPPARPAHRRAAGGREPAAALPRTAAPGAAGPLPRPRARTIPFFCRTKVEPFTRLDTTATLKPSDTAAGPGLCAAPSPAAAPTAIRIAVARAQRCRRQFCAGTAPRCAPRPPGAAPRWARRGDGSRMTSYHPVPLPPHAHVL